MLFSLLSVALYLAAVFFITPVLIRAQAGEPTQKPNKTLFFSTALLAVISHFISLLALIVRLAEGQAFTLLEFGSLLSLVIALLATFAMLRVNTLWFLLPVVYSFAIINIVLAELVPGHIVQSLTQDTGLLIHIVLALFAYAVCFIAMLYSFQLGWIDRNLKNKKTAFSPVMPPLVTVERHFFRVLLSGEILLTLTLVSGAVYLPDFFAAQNIQKAVLSLFAWLVFGLLLTGLVKWHWRGKRMIICTISGMILLSIAYFGSRAMLGGA